MEEICHLPRDSNRREAIPLSHSSIRVHPRSFSLSMGTASALVHLVQNTPSSVLYLALSLSAFELTEAPSLSRLVNQRGQVGYC
jgi:hypothetical protein